MLHLALTLWIFNMTAKIGTIRMERNRAIQGQKDMRTYNRKLTKQLDELKQALAKIAKWHGEFPPTGCKWDDGTEMSYVAAHGTNGERDYMRAIAQDALDNLEK